MKPLWNIALRLRMIFQQLTADALELLSAAPAFIQSVFSCENAVGLMDQAFISTVARDLPTGAAFDERIQSL